MEGSVKAQYAPEKCSHQGVLGVEWDAQLVPSQFRPTEGDRIALFGRWILDAGHNFHTEIDPPLLMVTASGGGGFTSAKITSRPYLVSEHWPEGSIFDHLIAELEKIPFESTSLEAHPTVWATPFSGRQSMTMVLRASTPPAGRTLQVSYSLTARSGVSVAMTPALPDGVQIDVTFDSASYQAPSLPPQTPVTIQVDDLAKQAGVDSGAAAVAKIVGAIVGAILTDSYTLPPGWAPPYTPPPTVVDVAHLSGVISVAVNDQQPYPLIGYVWLLNTGQ